jgi:hypothetical protein
MLYRMVQVKSLKTVGWKIQVQKRCDMRLRVETNTAHFPSYISIGRYYIRIISAGSKIKKTPRERDRKDLWPSLPRNERTF